MEMMFCLSAVEKEEGFPSMSYCRQARAGGAGAGGGRRRQGRQHSMAASGWMGWWMGEESADSGATCNAMPRTGAVPADPVARAHGLRCQLLLKLTAGTTMLGLPKSTFHCVPVTVLPVKSSRMMLVAPGRLCRLKACKARGQASAGLVRRSVGSKQNAAALGAACGPARANQQLPGCCREHKRLLD